MRQLLAFCCVVVLAVCITTLLLFSAKLDRAWYSFLKRPGIELGRQPNHTLRSENYETTSPMTSLERFGLKNITLLQHLPHPRPLYDFVITPRTAGRSRRFSGTMAGCAIIVMVKSVVNNTKRRMAIRKTWGSVKYLDGLVIETVFIVGINSTRDTPSGLVDEAEKYGDVLAFQGEDVYEKLYHKIFSGIQWACEQFSPDWLMASSDDDVVLHIKRFRDQLNVLPQATSGDGFTQDACSKLPIFCAYRLVRHARPLRSRASKWRVDLGQYPLPSYPPYCLGAFYAMPLATAGQILNISRNLPEFKIDDVWITGILRMLVEARNLETLNQTPEIFRLVGGGESVHHVWDAKHSNNFTVEYAISEVWDRWKVTDGASEFFVKKP